MTSMMIGPQFTRPQFTGLSGLGAMLKSYHKLQLKPESVAKFEAAFQLIWFALLEKAIDNAVKDHCKRLQACMSAISGHFEQYNNLYNRY